MVHIEGLRIKKASMRTGDLEYCRAGAGVALTRWGFVLDEERKCRP